MAYKNGHCINLPMTHDNGCYEIRMESIGGLGANLCGSLLGELGAVYLGLNAAAFSSYGSEKRGSPVKSYVRFSAHDCEILHNSPVERPHMLVLFHQALSRVFPVTAGVEEYCKIVVNTDRTPEEVREDLRLHAGEIYCVNALGLALESKSRLNMVMLGAIARASGFLPIDAVKALVCDTLGEKYPTLLDSNLRGIDLGFHHVVQGKFPPDSRFQKVEYKEETNKWGYANAPLGGVNPHIGSTISNDLTPSREGYLPLFLPEKCIHCGLCDTTCPDMVFQFLQGEYRGKQIMMNRGLDYRHCKGCLRCVDVCPTGALVIGKENEHLDKKYFVRNKDLIADDIDFEPQGANPWVTGEAHLDEKRIDGGLM